MFVHEKGENFAPVDQYVLRNWYAIYKKNICLIDRSSEKLTNLNDHVYFIRLLCTAVEQSVRVWNYDFFHGCTVRNDLTLGQCTVFIFLKASLFDFLKNLGTFLRPVNINP